jgi:hypothetical protein
VKFGSDDKGDKPKSKGALAAMIVGSDPRSSSSDSEPDLEVDVEEPAVDHGFRAVAKAFGIPPEREASAQAALKQYIKSCAGSASEDEEY